MRKWEECVKVAVYLRPEEFTLLSEMAGETPLSRYIRELIIPPEHLVFRDHRQEKYRGKPYKTGLLGSKRKDKTPPAYLPLPDKKS